jgi:hypothetical protein
MAVSWRGYVVASGGDETNPKETIMHPATAVDVIDVILDELVTLRILPVARYEDMSAGDREKLVRLLVARYGEVNEKPDENKTL